MTMDGLREALREAAREVDGYDVLDRAIARGRRRRRLSMAASGLATLAVLGLTALVAVPPLTHDGGPAEPPDVPTIPERIGPPAPFTPDAADHPPGRASLLISGIQGKLVVVGATDDTYRVIDTDAEPGRDALLSPVGHKVAYADRTSVRVVDLMHGGTRTYLPADSTVDEFAPSAWLPDSTGLVVVATTYPDDPTTQGIRTELSILDLATGVLDEFAEATWPIATPGFAVAVSPDGNRIAYQFADFVTVFDRTTRAKTRFDLASYYFVLAGRAAWAPDGSLTLLHKKWKSVGRGEPRVVQPAWELHLVDPTDGTLRGLIPVPGSPTVVRLIGWSEGGDPVVVTYEGPYDAMHGGPGDVILSGFDGTVGVARLSNGQAHVLVHPHDRINFIDVAEALLTDPRTRPGDPPWALPPFDRVAATLCLLITAAVLVAAWMRVNQRQSPAVPPTGDSA